MEMTISTTFSLFVNVVLLPHAQFVCNSKYSSTFLFFFLFSKFIAGNFRVLVEVLNRKINSFVAGMVNMLGSVAS